MFETCDDGKMATVTTCWFHQWFDFKTNKKKKHNSSIVHKWLQSALRTRTNECQPLRISRCSVKWLLKPLKIFLWSLRRPQHKEASQVGANGPNLQDVLPRSPVLQHPLCLKSWAPTKHKVNKSLKDAQQHPHRLSLMSPQWFLCFPSLVSSHVWHFSSL